MKLNKSDFQVKNNWHPIPGPICLPFCGSAPQMLLKVGSYVQMFRSSDVQMFAWGNMMSTDVTLLMFHSGLEDALLPPSGDASPCPGLWTCHAGYSRISFWFFLGHYLFVNSGLFLWMKVMLGDQEWIVLSGLDEVRRPYSTFLSFEKTFEVLKLLYGQK